MAHRAVPRSNAVAYAISPPALITSKPNGRSGGWHSRENGRGYLWLLLRASGRLFLPRLPGLGFLGFFGAAAGRAAAGIADAALAVTGGAIHRNNPARTIAAPCKFFFMRNLTAS